MLLKNSDGKKSASFTMMITGFIVVTLWLLVSIVQKIGNIQIRQFSSTEAMAYLSPLLLLYFGRRYTDANTTGSNTTPTPTAPSKTGT